MEIKYLGRSSFFIKSKDARIVTDPFDPKKLGLKFPKVESEIVTVSHDHPDHNNVTGVGGTPLILNWPGQYEKQGVRVWGYSTFHDAKEGAERGKNILYKIETEGITILHCGDLGVVPDDKFIDEIGDVQILMIPVGGNYTIDSEMAIKIIKDIEPSIIIPMHYHAVDNDGLLPVDEFLKKMGAEKAVPLEKLTLKKEDLIEEEMKVVLLSS